LSKYTIKYESLGYDSISPAKKFIPDWYKNNSFDSLKSCAPFLDAFLSGYIISLPYDLHVYINNGVPEIKLSDGSIYNGSTRSSESIDIIPFNHYEVEFAWDLCTALTIPSGASVLFTHPLNRHDLPFTTLSAVIDGEFTLVPHGAIPFYIKQGFQGVIKSGTPVAQVIPFGNDSWKAELETGLFESSKKHRRSKAKDWYKKSSWRRKSYD
jgi:hypothetical protein